jgi:protein-S-isoprenylcysteine O-methyltransferase Ste14
MESKKHDLTHEQQITYWGSFPPIIQFLGLIIGIIFEYFFPTKMFPPHTSEILGIVLIILGSIIIFSAQKASAAFRARERRGEVRVFHKGAYRWFHNPTSFALALLVIGLGFILNSLMIVLLSAVGYWLSYIVYEEKKQRIMTEKYKDDYTNYKKKIKSIF